MIQISFNWNDLKFQFVCALFACRYMWHGCTRIFHGFPASLRISPTFLTTWTLLTFTSVGDYAQKEISNAIKFNINLQSRTCFSPFSPLIMCRVFTLFLWLFGGGLSLYRALRQSEQSINKYISILKYNPSQGLVFEYFYIWYFSYIFRQEFELLLWWSKWYQSF